MQVVLLDRMQRTDSSLTFAPKLGKKSPAQVHMYRSYRPQQALLEQCQFARVVDEPSLAQGF